MPLTARDLVSTPELGLRLIVESPVVDRTLTWVHVSELRDPTPFLSGGELLLTTGITFDDATDADEYVRRLSEVAVVGVGFGIGLSHASVPDELIVAARRYGLPILEVPHQTPFIAISRAVSRAVAADEYAAVTRTFTAQQALTKAALAATGPDRLVRLLAQQVTGWVVLLDRSGAPIASYPEKSTRTVQALAAEMAVLAAHRGPVSSGFPLGADTVSLQSVGTGSRGRAFLAVGRPGPLTASDRHLVNAAVMLLTIRLEQSTRSEAGRGHLRSAVMRLVLAGQHEVARPIAAELGAPLPVAPLHVVVGVGEIAGVLAQLDDSGPLTSGTMIAAEVDDTVVVVVGGAGEPGDVGTVRTQFGAGDAALAGQDATAECASRIGMAGLALAAEAGGAAALFVGVSPLTGYDDIAAAHRQASRAAAFGSRNLRSVTSFDEISMPGIVGLLDADAADAFAESLLRPLIEHDLSGRGDLVNSLRVWLTHHGQWDPSAAALGVHRHTLRHRMNTVETLLGRSLDAPGARSELWLALEVLGRE